MNNFLKINYLIIVIYFTYSLFYINNPPIILLSILGTIIYIFLLIELYGSKRKININFIFLTTLLLFIFLVNFKSNPSILFYGIILLFVWSSLLSTIYGFAKGKISYLVKNNFYSSTYYNLISDVHFKSIAKINLLVIPLFLLIIFIFKIENNFLSHILVCSTILVPLLLMIYLLSKKYLFIKKESIGMICEYLNNYNPDTVIYFSGNNKSTYQLNSWIPFINGQKNNFVIILRERPHILNLEKTSYPVLYLSNTLDVEKISKINSIKVALYTTNVGKNIHLIRENNIKHVFIGHGDSDKTGSANNLMKMYNHMFVAGQAHIDRLANKKISVQKNYFFNIGRPQLEILKLKKNSKKFNVLYAPTWEGYYSDSCYSSLGILSNEIEKISNNNNIELNFKSHPLAGTINSQYKNHINKMKLLSKENHNILYQYFHDADILITDISAIISDFLYFNKPIILYKPKFIRNMKKESGISECTYIVDDSTNLIDLINQIKIDDYLLEKRKEMKKYVMGGSKPSVSRFSKALDEIKNL